MQDNETHTEIKSKTQIPTPREKIQNISYSIRHPHGLNSDVVRLHIWLEIIQSSVKTFSLSKKVLKFFSQIIHIYCLCSHTQRYLYILKATLGFSHLRVAFGRFCQKHTFITSCHQSVIMSLEYFQKMYSSFPLLSLMLRKYTLCQVYFLSLLGVKKMQPLLGVFSFSVRC